jgi:hypothetical protein
MERLSSESGRFDELLQLEDALRYDSYGEVKNSFAESIKTHKGTKEDPIPFPHVEYSETVHQLIQAVYNFNKANPEYDLYHYMDVLGGYGYKENIDVDTIDVSKMDDKCLMALFMALVRGERFCDGLILGALESGAVLRWIERLREISVS